MERKAGIFGQIVEFVTRERLLTVEQIQSRRLKRMSERRRIHQYKAKREFELTPGDYLPGGYAPVMLVGIKADGYWAVDAFALRDKTEIGPYPPKKGNGKIIVPDRPLLQVVQTAIEWVDDSTNGCDLMAAPKTPGKQTDILFRRLIHVRQLPLAK